MGDIIIPEEKEALVQKGYDEVEQVINNYNMGFITNNERYNQVIDIWTHELRVVQHPDENHFERRSGIQFCIHDVGFRSPWF
ncbi:DNA-directed RNA polymerase, beta' subunit [human gut metagenome]|uniref:DNA-directed RNA polymerase n=1 Tax=human gut metagenome TaxID=408170 RepID=K1SC29_9ZZZZ